MSTPAVPKLMTRPAVDAVLDYLADEVGYASFARDLRAHIAALETLHSERSARRDVETGREMAGSKNGRWTFDNCPDHHYRAMGMCPYCGDTLEAARARNEGTTP